MRLLLNKNGHRISAIKFNGEDSLSYLKNKFSNKILGSKIDIAYYTSINEFRGNRKLQILIKDLR